MKYLILALTVFTSSAWALQLVPEAICTGEENGRTVAVSSHVDPQKFCSGASKFTSAVIVQGQDELPNVYSTTVRERGHYSVHQTSELEAKFDLTSEGVGELRRNGAVLKLRCDFIQYEIEC